jgi:hypothetical protein
MAAEGPGSRRREKHGQEAPDPTDHLCRAQGAHWAAAEATLTIAADPKHLGANIGITAVLHTWGSTMTHHPHVHMIVPGGGISLDGSRWVSCRPRFFLPVPVFSKAARATRQ